MLQLTNVNFHTMHKRYKGRNKGDLEKFSLQIIIL